MKPAPGHYRLTTIAPPVTVTYEVTDTAIHTTFGDLEWFPDPPPGMFRKGDIAIRFLDNTNFVAVNGPYSYAGTWGPA